ncbi:hypothetical protein J6590_042636 [Homalodisca vitripennis]|nr:hypothetical protein J6590_042636 [Homalodisca vitripennis]
MNYDWAGPTLFHITVKWYVLDEYVSSENDASDIEAPYIPSDISLRDFSRGSGEEYEPDPNELSSSDEDESDTDARSRPNQKQNMNTRPTTLPNCPMTPIAIPPQNKQTGTRVFSPEPEIDIVSKFQVDCAKQNNNYECGLNVLMYAKVVNEAYNKMLQIPFLDWYIDVILHVNSDLSEVCSSSSLIVSPTDQPELMKVQLKPASLEAGWEQSDELGWVTVQTSGKIHPSTSLDVSFEHNNPYSILSSLDESEPPCEVVGVTPRVSGDFGSPIRLHKSPSHLKRHKTSRSNKCANSRTNVISTEVLSLTPEYSDEENVSPSVSVRLPRRKIRLLTDSLDEDSFGPRSKKLHNRLLFLYSLSKHLDSSHPLRVSFIQTKKEFRNRIHSAKAKKVLTYISGAQNKQRAAWNVVKDLIPDKKAKAFTHITLKDENGDLMNNPRMISEKFNIHFAEIRQSLRDSEGSSSFVSPKSLSSSSMSSSIFFARTDKNEIISKQFIRI